MSKKDILNSYAEKIVNRIEFVKLSCGKKQIIPTIYYVDMILFVLTSGCSWNSLENLPNLKCKGDSIRKQYNRWMEKGIFDDIHTELLNQYKDQQIFESSNDNPINEIFIDSTDILNDNGTKDMTGYGYKFKNKRAIRLHCGCDKNNIISANFTKASIHESKMTIPLLSNPWYPLGPTYHQPIYVAGDTAYLSEPIKKILKESHIHLICPYRSNMNKKNSSKYSKILKKRFIIEHTNNLLKRGFKRLNHFYVYERSVRSYMTFLKMANTCQIIKILKI